MVPPRHTHLFWLFDDFNSRRHGLTVADSSLMASFGNLFHFSRAMPRDWTSRRIVRAGNCHWRHWLSIFIYLYKKKVRLNEANRWAMEHNIWRKQKQSLSEMTATQTRTIILLHLWVGGNLKISTRSSGLHFCVTSTLKPCDPRRSPVTEEEESCILAIRILIDTLDLTFRWEEIFTEWDNLSWGEDVGRRLNCREATRYGRSM